MTAKVLASPRRHAASERTQHRSVAAVADDGGRPREDRVLGNPALDVDVRRQPTELGRIGTLSDRDQNGASRPARPWIAAR
jgi:hypothetical protein